MQVAAEGSGRFQKVPMQGQVQVARAGRKVPERSGEGSGEGLGSFGAEPGHCSTGVCRRLWKRFRRNRDCLVQNQVKRFREMFCRRFQKVLMRPDLRGFKQVPMRFRRCVGVARRPCSNKFWTTRSVKINYCCCWGYQLPPKLISSKYVESSCEHRFLLR